MTETVGQPGAGGQVPAKPGPGPGADLLTRYWPALATAAGLLVVSLIVVVLAGTRPGFDPYGWLVWGHQTVAGSLDTNAAPSWKPLPYLFVVPYAISGHYELWLWMVTSVAVAFSGVIFAGRIAYKLTPITPDRRYPAIVAAVFAGAALLGIRDYWHYILSFQSDPMVVSLCLGAVDCHLSKRYRWAFVLGVLASLARPEVWLFLGLYAIWAWRAVPEMRGLIIGGVVVLGLLWFAIPALSSRSAFVAGSNAQGSGRALHNNKVFGTIDRFLDMHETPLELAALLALAFGIWRRDRIVLGLAAAALAWVIVEIAFSLHGWPGLPRYMFAAGALTVVLAGVGVGRLLTEPRRVSAARAGGPVARAGGPVAGAGPGGPVAGVGGPVAGVGGPVARVGGPVALAAAALAVVIAAGLVPAALSRARTEHKDLRAQRKRTHVINRLAATVNHYGGPARFHGCGEPLTRLEYQTILAWTLRVNVARVGYKYAPAIRSGRPIVLFTPTSHGGWRVQALHQHLHHCRTLPR